MKTFTLTLLLLIGMLSITNAQNFWSQIGQNVDGEAAGDNSGRSVSLYISTVGEIYDYDIGDVFHYKYFRYWSGYVDRYTNKKIINKYYSLNNDTVYYIFSVAEKSSSSKGTAWAYEFYTDTLYYTNLDSLINSGNINSVDSNTSLYNGRKINAIEGSSSGESSSYWSRKWVDGCGRAIYHSYTTYYKNKDAKPPPSSGTEDDLVYYKKGLEEWGTPNSDCQLSQSTAPDVNLDSNITILLGQTVIIGIEDSLPNYLWNTGETTAQIVVIADSLGIGTFEFWLQSESVPGCIGSDTIFITVIDNIYVNEINNENTKIYPNPTTGQITIESDKTIEQVEVVSITGNTVKQITNNKEQITIDLSNEAKGIYFVKLIGEGFVSTQKLVLE